MKKIFSVLTGMALLLAVAIVGGQQSTDAAGKNYDYFVVGNSNDVTTPTSYGLMLMGGGTDVDSAFQWMIGKSGGGDFVVIRATGTDAYNPYIAGLGALDSVETLIIKSRTGANDPFVVNKIRNAEAVFIAGGDQWDYVNFWKDTQVEDAINYVANVRQVPVGGTSAGLAVLGEFMFSAKNGSVTSADALADPFNRRVALDRQFLGLPLMAGIITDSHFVERDRMGRTVTFLARLIQDGWTTSPVKAIAVDSQTAVVVEANGNASLRGTNTAYFLRTPGAPQVCQSRTPLTFNNLSVFRMSGGATFNLSNWSGSGGTNYTISATNGALTSSIGSIY
ncbi:MAG: cyanophycinase [Acidobacteria bacterium]|nr:cyanophycinase [Acidobacteriota bacterium]